MITVKEARHACLDLYQKGSLRSLTGLGLKSALVDNIISGGSTLDG